MFRKAETELRRATQMLSDIQLALNESCIVAVLNPEGVITYVNQMAVRVLAEPPDRIEGQPYTGFVADGQEDVLKSAFDSLYRGEVWHGELQIKPPGGTPLWFQATGVPFLSDRGVLEQVITVHTDITFRKQAEIARKVRERQLRTLIDSLPEGIVFKDKDGRWLEANEKIRDLYGICTPDWRGKTLAEMRPKTLDAAQIAERQERESHARSQGQSLRYETWLYHGNDDICIDGTVIPLFNDDGTENGAVVIDRDVTELKASQQSLLQTKQELESIIENSADCFGVVALDGQILQVNSSYERLFGWTAEEVVGKPTPYHHEEVMRWLAIIRDGGQVTGEVTTRHRKDGSEIHISATVSPVWDARGQIVAASIISRDITDRLKEEEFLRRSDRLSLVGQMAAGIAHEIRNPLASLKGFTQLIREGSDRRIDHCDVMLRELDRMNRIVDELLLLARPQKESYDSKSVWMILADVVTLLRTQANEKNVAIQCHFGNPDVHVNCVENRLKQVFINVLKNAIEATPAGRGIRLDVTASPSRDSVTIRCTDEGCGIPKEQLAKLGDPFFTTKPHGTGLGLMVTLQIVQSHGGHVNVHSEEHVGTTVDIILPAIPIAKEIPGDVEVAVDDLFDRMRGARSAEPW